MKVRNAHARKRLAGRGHAPELTELVFNTLQAGFKYIENESFESTFHGLFSEINLNAGFVPCRLGFAA